jgi:hypothetical protein
VRTGATFRLGGLARHRHLTPAAIDGLDASSKTKPCKKADSAHRSPASRFVTCYAHAHADVRACLPGGELRSDHLVVYERKWKVHPAS